MLFGDYSDLANLIRKAANEQDEIGWNNNTDLFSKVVHLKPLTQPVQVDPVIVDGPTKAGLEAFENGISGSH